MGWGSWGGLVERGGRLGFCLEGVGDFLGGAMTDQARFETVYRGRQSWLHHVAYMRMCKVLLALRALRLGGVNLAGKKIFDYGFGAGTLFRYVPKSATLCGVEQDPVVVEEVGKMLRSRGYENVDLCAIDIATWREHALLQQQYDLFVCSHVLEHLADPVDFLQFVSAAVKPDGCFLGLVPVNERAPNPHHLQVVDKKVVRGWAVASGFEMLWYEENDPFLYWLQPLFTATNGWRHKLAQLISLDVGVSAKIFGERAWFSWGAIVGRLSRSKPTQAAFVLRPRTKAVAGGE
jgi:2-polyprenyl-3-methyl-5-hydroxy-6-metoxy-1,4-benzoquinol methylase